MEEDQVKIVLADPYKIPRESAARLIHSFDGIDLSVFEKAPETEEFLKTNPVDALLIREILGDRRVGFKIANIGRAVKSPFSSGSFD